MSTKRELYKLTNETYRKCEDMQHVPIKEFKDKEKLMELINKQNELKDKFKFYKHLNRYIKEKENEKN
jgi:hypothetical protein